MFGAGTAEVLCAFGFKAFFWARRAAAEAEAAFRSVKFSWKPKFRETWSSISLKFGSSYACLMSFFLMAFLAPRGNLVGDPLASGLDFLHSKFSFYICII